MFIFGFFGFYRKAQDYSYNFDIKSSSYKKYVFTPSIINEDSTIEVEQKMLTHKYGNDSILNIYEYDKEKHIRKYNKISNEKFINQWYQQAYRIFSFFYNIGEVAKMIKKDNYDQDAIVILCRIDVGLTIENEKDIKRKLDECDVLVGGPMKRHGVDDKFFILKYKNLDVFINLYDDYELYIANCINKIKDRPRSTRPEDVILYHLTKYNMKIEPIESVKCQFRHVCSKYCGHNKKNTLT